LAQNIYPAAVLVI